MFLLGRHLAGPAAGLLAAALSAASPTFLIQLFQPMNDVTAAALWAAALVAAISAGARGTLSAAAGAGLLTAAALVVRPNLVPLAAVTGIGVMLLARDRTIVIQARMRRSVRGGCGRRAARRAGGAERDVRLAVQVGLRRSRQDVLGGARPAQPRALSAVVHREPHDPDRHRAGRAVCPEALRQRPHGVVAARVRGRDARLLPALRRVRRLVVHALPASRAAAVAGAHRGGARRR